MRIDLDKGTEELIRLEVEAGRYASPQELVGIAVRQYLDECEARREFSPEEVQAAIDEGLRDAAEGRLIDEEEFRKRVEELKTLTPTRMDA